MDANNKNLGEKLFESGIFIIHEKMSSADVGDMIIRLLALKAENPTKEIKLYISASPLYAQNMFAIYDVVKTLPNPISTYSIGTVGGTALILIGLADKGKRYILKHSDISFGELSTVINGGQQTEIEIIAEEMTRTRIIFEQILADQTGKNVEEIHKDLQNRSLLERSKLKNMD